MTQQEIRQGIAELSPWHHEFELPHGLRTTSCVPPEVAQVFRTKLDMLEALVEGHFGRRLSEVDCLDVGCGEGFYAVAVARKGVRRVTAIDFRESNLAKARFVAGALGIDNLSFRRGACEELRVEEIGRYDLTLVLGLVYHLESPMLCLRNAASVTKELCVVESQVIDEVEGSAEWGWREWTRPYQGALALIDESAEFSAGNPQAGNTPMAMCPSPKALTFMLRRAGFPHVETVPPPPDAYEQYRRGKRIVCAAYR